MATRASAGRGSEPRTVRDDRFFLTTALVMAAILVAGFSMQLAMGRSSFAAPFVVHLHGVVFFGWVTIFVMQTALATRGSMKLHRRLGWLAVAWSAAMVAIGIALMFHVVRSGTAPFFFQPQHFFVANILGLLGFAGLTWAAVAMRRRTDWHRRLHVASMTILLGPAFGRLLPIPFMIPWSFQVAALCSAAFLLILMVLDARRVGRLHRAWSVGLAVSLATLVAAQVVAFGPAGNAIYRAVTAGSPGAAVSPLAFPPPPPGIQITGR